MKKRYMITAADGQEARQRMKRTKGSQEYRRLQVIALCGEGLSDPQIVQSTGYSLTRLPKLRKRFCIEGFEGLKDHRTQSHNWKVSFEQEAEFLEKYRASSEKAELLTVTTMWQDFMTTFKVSYTIQAFYKMLKRHKWRKVRPRPQHPKKADAPTIAASKKLSLLSKKI